MPFAANGKIAQEKTSFDESEEFIEITDEQYLEALDGMQKGLAATIDGGFKVAPPPPEPPPAPTKQEIAAATLYGRDRALSVAAIRIAPLQDAVDIDDATPEDVEMLKKWKQYRIALNRIQDQTGFPLDVSWPDEPSAK